MQRSQVIACHNLVFVGVLIPLILLIWQPVSFLGISFSSYVESHRQIFHRQRELYRQLLRWVYQYQLKQTFWRYSLLCAVEQFYANSNLIHHYYSQIYYAHGALIELRLLTASVIQFYFYTG